MASNEGSNVNKDAEPAETVQDIVARLRALERKHSDALRAGNLCWPWGEIGPILTSLEAIPDPQPKVAQELEELQMWREGICPADVGTSRPGYDGPDVTCETCPAADGCGFRTQYTSRQAMSNSVHSVQLVYSSPTGYMEDRYTTVAAFSTEERAHLFVQWAEKERKRILEETKALVKEIGFGALVVPDIIKMHLPTDHYGTDHYHFQYDDEVDLDPTFG